MFKDIITKEHIFLDKRTKGQIMSDMNYKKKYKEAMDRMELCVRSGLKITTEYIFPELAESEDERIRKALKQYFVNSFKNNGVAAICGVHVKDVLAWLEKQCQVKESTISQHEIETCKENNNSLTSEDEKVRKALLEMVHDTTGDELWVDYGVHKEEALAWLEKQEGCEYIKKDWLEHIKQSWYKEGLIDGKYSGGTSKEWTINDAATLKELIDFLENGTAKLQHDLTRYANWLKNQFAPIERQGEQKPVDKIEPKFKVGDKIYLKPEYRMPNDDTPIANTVKEIRRIDDKHYRFDGSYIFIEDQDKYELVEQKPKENKGNIGGISPNWSEEDDKVRTTIINEFEQCSEWCCANGLTKEDCIDWLQSLKNRVQPKQEWSVEDERNLQGVIDEIEANKNQAPDYDLATYDRFLSWLKSLKGRVQPKVELTQLDKNILEAAIAFVEKNNHFNYWGGVDKQTVLSALRSLRSQK